MNTANMLPLYFPAEAIPAEYTDFNKYHTAAGKNHRDQINNAPVSIPYKPVYIHWMKVELFPQYSIAVWSPCSSGPAGAAGAVPARLSGDQAQVKHAKHTLPEQWP